jgi:hypothetical protein
MIMNYKSHVHIGGYNTGHVQGITVDKDRKYMYCSFTTCLIKADLNGNVVGSVRGLAGHLGCIAYNEEDGRVYGSLAFKHDKIGRDILNRSEQKDVSDGFYIAIFDVDKIDRLDMDAENDGIMTAVYLNEVLKDYTADGHRYGCSGIDGTTFAPLPGTKDPKKYLYVAYGIYRDDERTDNDNQIILRYDISDWSKYEHSLNQSDMHRFGPDNYDDKYMVFTGNTNYGIQNLEYDPFSGYVFAAVYRGYKPQYPNYPMFVFDISSPEITLANIGELHEASGIRGYHFPYGATGMFSFGDGYFYFSQEYKDVNGYGTHIYLYQFDKEQGFIKA